MASPVEWEGSRGLPRGGNVSIGSEGWERAEGAASTKAEKSGSSGPDWRTVLSFTWVRISV